MLKAINTKLLIAILAALAVIGGLLVRQNGIRKDQAAAAARTAAVLEQQQRQAAAEQKYREDEAKKVNQMHRSKNNMPDKQGGTWTHYIP